MFKGEIEYYWYGLVLGILLGFCVTLIFMIPQYKKGQIDAINGIIKYELVKQNNGSSEWEKKE